MTQRYGLIGWPVAHSVSPPMQEAGFAALGLDATYELVPLEPESLEAGVADLKTRGFCGWNITVPHKQTILPLLDEIDPNAAAGGSVNTVVNRDGRLTGNSTDGYGLEHAIRDAFRLGVQHNRFLFWGCGGAARACAVHFAANGAAAVLLVNRTRSKAEALSETLKSLSPQCEVRVYDPADTITLHAVMDSVDAVIQSTSVGLHEGDPSPIPKSLLAPELNILDMIYRVTPLLKLAREQGCHTATGRGMLLHQGVRSLELWTQQDAPVAAMRAALDEALDA